LNKAEYAVINSGLSEPTAPNQLESDHVGDRQEGGSSPQVLPERKVEQSMHDAKELGDA